MSETAYNVARQGVAGGGGGLIAFLLLERWMLRSEAQAELLRHSPAAEGNAIGAMMLFGAAIGSLIAAALTFGDELGTARLPRIAGRSLLALLIGAVAGGIAAAAAQILFSHLLDFAILLLLPARVIGWALAGGGLGLAAGAVTGSATKVRQGLRRGPARRP